MLNEIKCPNCGSFFQVEEAMAEEYKKELRAKMEEYMKNKNMEFRQKEKEWQDKSRKQEELWQQQVEEEKKQLRNSIEENLRKNLAADFEHKLFHLRKVNEENEERLKEARQQQLAYLKREDELKRKEEEMEISLQRRLQEERARLSEDIRKMEEQKTAARETEYHLKMKELEKQLDDQKKLAEEMRRKAEQGSMQLQGEVQELALEALLRLTHPFDLVEEVPKGIKGADSVQTVRNQMGQVCGKIIYESKRTREFSMEWIEKLKADMRSLGADIAIIVTQAMPRDMDTFGEKDGVWICRFSEVKAVTSLVRDGLIRIAHATRTQENKGDKMHMLYNYLTGNEFAAQWKAISEGFHVMKLSIQKERETMERLWKAREKQLEKVLLNAVHIRGSVEGIAGQDAIDLSLTDGESVPLIDE